MPTQESLAYGVISFDHIGVAFVMLMKALTLDDWATPMFALMRAASSWGAILYFLLIVTIGGFFLVNLFLAVIFEEFLQRKTVDQAIEVHLTDSPEGVVKEDGRMGTSCLHEVEAQTVSMRAIATIRWSGEDAKDFSTEPSRAHRTLDT